MAGTYIAIYVFSGGKKRRIYDYGLKIPGYDTPDKLQPCGAFIQAANKDKDLDSIDDVCDPEITDPILYTARNGKPELNEDKEDDKGNNISKGMPIVLVKDINEKCYALKPEDYLSPALRPGSNGYKPRGLIKLSKLPKGVGCEKE